MQWFLFPLAFSRAKDCVVYCTNSKFEYSLSSLDIFQVIVLHSSSSQLDLFLFVPNDSHTYLGDMGRGWQFWTHRGAWGAPEARQKFWYQCLFNITDRIEFHPWFRMINTRFMKVIVVWWLWMLVGDKCSCDFTANRHSINKDRCFALLRGWWWRLEEMLANFSEVLGFLSSFQIGKSTAQGGTVAT